MTDIWQGFFYTDNSDADAASLDISADTGIYYGTGADINAEIKISEQVVSDFINLKPDGKVMH